MEYYEEQDRLTTLGLRRPEKDDWHHGFPEYKVERDDDRCIRCLVCVRQCPYDATFYDPVRGVLPRTALISRLGCLLIRPANVSRT